MSAAHGLPALHATTDSAICRGRDNPVQALRRGCITPPASRLPVESSTSGESTRQALEGDPASSKDPRGTFRSISSEFRSSGFNAGHSSLRTQKALGSFVDFPTQRIKPSVSSAFSLANIAGRLSAKASARSPVLRPRLADLIVSNTCWLPRGSRAANRASFLGTATRARAAH